MTISMSQYEELLKMMRSTNVDDIALAGMYLETKPVLDWNIACAFCGIIAGYTIDKLNNAFIGIPEGSPEYEEILNIKNKYISFLNWCYRKSKLTPYELAQKIKMHIKPLD